MKKAQKQKPATKALARTRPSQVPRYEPPPPPPSYQYERSPGLDPHTRHLLVNLETQVREFSNVRDRVADLQIAARKLENQLADNVPEQWWRQLQFQLSSLDAEFKARVPALERNYSSMEFLVARMTRLEAEVTDLKFEVERLRGEQHEKSA